MMRNSEHRPVIALLVLVLAGFSAIAAADDPDRRTRRNDAGMAADLAGSGGLMPASDQDKPAITLTESEDSPFSLDLTYSLYSDYVFRGINFSEFKGEGREKLNHQLDISVTLDLGAFLGNGSGTNGTLNFGVWFEWYGAQKKIDPVDGGQNLQEVDYYISWSYDIEDIATTLTLGYTSYSFPNLSSINTNEWWFGLEHNDAWMWKALWPDNDDGVFNPSFTFYQDFDQGAGNAIWIEIGLSHEFAINDRLSVTPSWLLAIDHDYYHHFAGDPHENTTRLAYMQWGMNVTYQLGEALGLTPVPKSVTPSGFLYFNDALGSAEDNGTIQDEFFGGVSIGFSF